jgi:hypothetical protein
MEDAAPGLHFSYLIVDRGKKSIGSKMDDNMHNLDNKSPLLILRYTKTKTALSHKF